MVLSPNQQLPTSTCNYSCYLRNQELINLQYRIKQLHKQVDVMGERIHELCNPDDGIPRPVDREDLLNIMNTIYDMKKNFNVIEKQLKLIMSECTKNKNVK